jgi:hypothetical protein
MTQFLADFEPEMSADQQANLFLVRSLQKIVADTQRKSQFAALRTACEDAVGIKFRPFFFFAPVYSRVRSFRCLAHH